MPYARIKVGNYWYTYFDSYRTSKEAHKIGMALKQRRGGKYHIIKGEVRYQGRLMLLYNLYFHTQRGLRR